MRPQKIESSICGSAEFCIAKIIYVRIPYMLCHATIDVMAILMMAEKGKASMKVYQASQQNQTAISGVHLSLLLCCYAIRAFACHVRRVSIMCMLYASSSISSTMLHCHLFVVATSEIVEGLVAAHSVCVLSSAKS